MSRESLISAILAASSPKPVKVEHEEVGTVYARVMTAYDADRTRKQLNDLKADDGCGTGRLLAALLCDETGALLFDITDAEVVLKLSKLPPGFQAKVLNVANAMNGAEPGKS